MASVVARGRSIREAAADIEPGTRDTGAERRFSFEGAQPLRVGLRFSAGMSFDRWVEIGRRVRAHEDASLWWLGDWLNYGRQMYGSRYQSGIELTGLEYQTLRNYAMVARRFDLSRRRDKLSFQHHAEVCALPSDAQERWLDSCEREHLTRNQLRHRLRNERQRNVLPVPPPLRLSVDAERRAIWLAAATSTGVALDTWIVRTLDDAAAATRLLNAV
jgi:hypothetical protein